MTKTGATWVSEAMVPVSTIGSLGDADGWSTVAIVPTSVWLSGTGNYAFHAGGMVGDVFYTGSPTRARIEVGLFEGSAATAPFKVHRHYLNDGPSNQLSGVRYRGLPWQMLSPVFAWTASKELIIKARIFRNGDASLVSGQFLVSDMSVLVFDLTRIGAGNYLSHTFTPTGGDTLNNLVLEGFKQYYRTNRFGAAGTKWLILSNIATTPRTAAGPAWYRTDVSPTDTWNDPTYLVGNTRWGTLLRGGGPSGASGGHVIRQTGISLVETANAIHSVGLRGLDRHSDSGARTILESWEVFIVKVSGQGHFTSHVDPLPNPRVLLARTQTDESEYWPVEVDTDFANDMTLIFSATNDWDIGGQHSFRTHAKMESGPPTVIRDRRQSIAVVDRTEGWNHHCIGLRLSAQRVLQHRFLVSRNPQEAATVELSMNDLCGVAFDFETNPNTTPYPGEITGPEVSISTGYEASGLASLNALPFVPDVQSPIAYAFERNELRTKRGDVITWPKFIRGRQVWGLRWTLSRDDAATLLAFLAAQDRRAFKMVSLYDTRNTMALVVVEDPRAEDNGLVHVVSAQCLELTWVGP